jgi:serine/threonine-protein kinase HipA
MGRRAHAKSLNVWMNGLPVGTWETTRDGEKLTYLEEWLADQQGRPLSLSLPFTAGNQPYRGEVVSHYFDNLLPDSKTIRERIAGRYKTGGTSPFELLAKLGRDCVGAIQLLPPDETPANLEQINGRPLNEADIARLLRETTASPVLGHHEPIDDLRLSIAGAQEKTALLWHDDRWFIPEGSTPTTHILKLPLGLLETCALTCARQWRTNGSARKLSQRMVCPSHAATLRPSRTRKFSSSSDSIAGTRATVHGS